MRSRVPWPRHAVLFVLFGLLFPACNGNRMPTEPARDTPAGAAEPREGFVTQTGFVLDFRTFAPIPGARVVFGSFDPAAPEYAATADASGTYRVEVPPHDYYLVSIDGVIVTSLTALVSSTRAHLFARADGCSAIYGVVDDARSGKPLQGAVVTSAGRTVTASGPEGWYRLDYGCGVNLGFNTMMAAFTFPGYESASHVVGRGAPSGARRIDVALRRPD